MPNSLPGAWTTVIVYTSERDTGHIELVPAQEAATFAWVRHPKAHRIEQRVGNTYVSLQNPMRPDEPPRQAPPVRQVQESLHGAFHDFGCVCMDCVEFKRMR